MHVQLAAAGHRPSTRLVRLGVGVTTSAAALAWFLAAVAGLSEVTVVLAVTVIAFAASWVATDEVKRVPTTRLRHHPQHVTMNIRQRQSH